MDKKQAITELEVVLNKLNSTTMGRRLFLASVPALMTACSSPGKHRHREGDNTGQKAALTVSEERKMTQEALKEMRKDYPPVKNSQLQRYIASLGQRVTTSSGLEGQPYNYNFTVVDVPQVNAFALPAGTIYVTAPLMAMVSNEAELAGVVGHEVGHVQARHTAERIQMAKEEKGNSWLLGAGGGLLGGLLGYGIGKAACGKDRDCIRKATELGAVAGIGGGLLIQKYKFMANSREDEMEADRIGFRTSVAAGFHKDHVGGFYAKLLKMEQQHKRKQNKLMASVADAMSTHPPSKERVKQMDQMARAQSPRRGAVVSSRGFNQIKSLAQNVAARHKKS